MKMYILIKNRVASKLELETAYTLDEALKLFALVQMEQDIQRIDSEDMQDKLKNSSTRR